MDIQKQIAALSNINISYTTSGNGDPIVLVHGWPTSSFLWRNMHPTLSKRYQVIAIDLPGFGDSDKPLDASYSLNFYVKVFDDFLSHLGLSKINLVVHDLGGPIGLLWAVRNKEKVSRLVLLNTLVYPEFSNAVKLFGLATLLPIIKTWLTSSKGIAKAMSFGVQKKEQLSTEILYAYQAPFQSKLARKVLLRSVQRIGKKGFIEIANGLTKIDYPVGLIYGENDRILPDVQKTMDRVKTDIPHAQQKSIPNCGHFLQEDEPEKLSQLLLTFLKDTEG